MAEQVKLSPSQYALYRKVRERPHGTYVRYGEGNRRNLDKLVLAGALYIDHGKRWGTPSRYAVKADAIPSNLKNKR